MLNNKIRKPVLYPAELWGQVKKIAIGRFFSKPRVCFGQVSRITSYHIVSSFSRESVKALAAIAAGAFFIAPSHPGGYEMVSPRLNMLDPYNRMRRPNAEIRRVDWHDQHETIAFAVVMRGAWAQKAKRTPWGVIRQCALCKRSELTDGTWALIINDEFKTTHGYCPACAAAELAKYRTNKA